MFSWLAFLYGLKYLTIALQIGLVALMALAFWWWKRR